MTKISKYLIFSSVIVGPFSIDIFLSAIPTLQKIYAGYDVSLFLGLSLLANCLGQAFAGPFLDRFGRKPVILAGLIAACFASIILGFCHNFYVLIFAKFLQTLGACASIVGCFAIARDIYHDDELPHTVGFILAMIGISPIIAPLIGSYLITAFNWRASFWFILLLAALYTLFITVFYKESLDPTHRNHGLNLKSFLANIWHIVKIPNFLAYTLAASCAYSIIFSFLNVSSLLLIKDFGLSKITYGWLVALNAIGIIVMSKVAPHITQKRSLNTSLTLGLGFMTLGSLLMITINYFYPNSTWTLMIPMFITTLGTGTIRPVTNAAAMILVPKHLSGQSAGTFSLITFSITTVAGIAVVSFVQSSTAFGIWNLSFAALGIIILLFRK